MVIIQVAVEVQQWCQSLGLTKRVAEVYISFFGCFFTLFQCVLCIISLLYPTQQLKFTSIIAIKCTIAILVCIKVIDYSKFSCLADRNRTAVIELYSKFKQSEQTMTNLLKEGSVVTYQVLQNTTTYQVRLTNTNKGLWMCIEESGLNWKLTLSQEMVEQTVAKASNHQENMNLKQFTNNLLMAISKTSDKWGVGIMTPVQLQLLRGGAPTKQANNNKIYLILSDKEKKLHYPFTFVMSEVGQKQRLIQAIKTMKSQLEDLRVQRSDKSQSSFSIMSETYNTAEQIRMENQEMKKRIKIYEESLTQKRGAVEIDLILKQKNNLEIQAETKKRQQNREITRLKNIYQLMDREIKEIENQVELINRQLLMLEDSVANSAKIKSHAMKVLRSYETELRTQKKVLQKQAKEIDNLKRNILTSKNNQRKVLAKIKQIQTEIDQCKKKTNIKEISNRLHSVGKGRGGSSVDSGSSKSQSVGGSSAGGKPRSDTSSQRVQGNLVRDNLLRKNVPQSSSNRNNNLLKTSPNMTPTAMKKTSSDKVPGARAINSSHQAPTSGTNARLFNTQQYRSNPKSDNDSSVKSESVKKEVSKEDKERQRRAMERLAGPRANVPKVPSVTKKNEMPNRLPSQTRNASSSLTKGVPLNKANSLSKEGGMKKDNAKELLLKMKQIKAHYNSQATKNIGASKNMVNKISELTDKNKV